MITKFRVKNFRNFNDWFEFDFKTQKNYEFSSFAIRNQTVKHGLIYGKNGCGKSNLGLAMVDLTSHLKDDIALLPSLADNYLNGNNSSELAEFHYEFQLENRKVIYRYGKTDRSTVVHEELSIDGDTVVFIDRRKSQSAKFSLKGAETLNTDLSSNRKISALKYLNANSVLDIKNDYNRVFKSLMNFVDGMVFFRTLKDKTESHGQQISIKRISEAIIKENQLKQFEDFLNDAEIKCELVIAGDEGDELIHFRFENKSLEFSRVASTGTISLGIYYYWWMQIKENGITFAFIDEFDAYYHQSLSKAIVRQLSKTETQTLLTTHNTSLLTNDLLRPDCYFELKDNKQYPFHQLVDKELRKAHNLEKIYKGLDADV